MQKILKNEKPINKKVMIVFGAVAAVCAAVISYPVPVLVPFLIYFKLGGAIATAISSMQLLSTADEKNKEANEKENNK